MPGGMLQRELRQPQFLFRPLAIGYVGCGSNKFNNIPGLVEDRPADAVNLSYRSIRQDDSKLSFKALLSCDRFPHQSAENGRVFGMEPFHGLLEPHTPTSRLHAKNPIVLFGPKDSFPLVRPPRPTSDMSQPLRLRQAILATPQFLFRATTLRYVVNCEHILGPARWQLQGS